MIHPKLARFIDLERMENIYQRLVSIDMDDLQKEKDFQYVKGGIDAILALIGINNNMAKLLGVDDELSDDEKKEFLKQFLRDTNPDAIEIALDQDYVDAEIPMEPPVNTSMN